MNYSVKHLSYEIELHRGEKLTLPPGLVESVGPGCWVITVGPADSSHAPIRNHAAFLNGYAPEDEGLYDADAGH